MQEEIPGNSNLASYPDSNEIFSYVSALLLKFVRLDDIDRNDLVSVVILFTGSCSEILDVFL